MTFRHCIFDFDGTLVNTLDDVMERLRLAFEQCAIPVKAFAVIVDSGDRRVERFAAQPDAVVPEISEILSLG